MMKLKNETDFVIPEIAEVLVVKLTYLNIINK
jgi:hypothetical protein